MEQGIPHMAATTPIGDALADVVVFLLAAILAALGVRQLKWSPVVGYLIAGAAIGPHGFALVADVAEVHLLAEFGVVFLMFTIGLELSPERLKAMRSHVFVLGGLQVVVTALVITLAGKAFAFSTPQAVIIGLALALSSTAVVTRLLMERDALSRPVGRRAFGVLLFQDMAVVPILLIVGAFGEEVQSFTLADLWGIGQALAAIGAMIFAGRYLARPFFRLVASAQSAELFAATTLLVVLASAWLLESVGLSLALGGFLAGVLLAETEYTTQVELDIEPYRGLLLGLFFITVGMAIDIQVVLGAFHWILLVLLLMLTIKAGVIIAIARALGLSLVRALRLGLLLAQAGEFGFVVFNAATAEGLLGGEVVQILIVAIGISIALTPALAALADRLDRRFAKRGLPDGDDLEATASSLEDHVVIAGYGRVGQTIARLLEEIRQPYIALDLDPVRVGAANKREVPAFFGNAGSAEVLKAAGLQRAAMLVITLDSPAAAVRAVTAARRVSPDLPIVARAHDHAHGRELERLGASAAVPETLEASLQLGGQVLRGMGMSHGASDDIIERLRMGDYAALSEIEPAERTS